MLNKGRLIEKGKKYYFRNMYEKAINIFNKFDTESSYFYLGLIYSETGNLKKAIQNFEKCLEMHKEKYKDNFKGDLIPVLEELLPLYWQEYLHSSDKLQKETLKELFKKRVEELGEINCSNMNYYRFSAISLEEENKNMALEMWEGTYKSSMCIQYEMSFGSEEPSTVFCSELGFNLNKFIERIASFKIMDISEDKKEALEYLFNPFRISHTKEFKKEKGLSLENILTNIEQNFLGMYNKTVCREVNDIENTFLKTGSLDTLTDQIKSSQNYSKNTDLQLALALVYYFKGKYGMSSKIMKSALNKIIKHKNKEIKNVDVKSKNEVKEYSHTFDSFRIFPKIDFIFKKYTKQEYDISQYYRKISYKRNLAFNLPQIVGSLNIDEDKWGVMLYEVKENASDYLDNPCGSKKKFKIISKIITILAELHAHSPSYDSGLISLLHTSDFSENKRFYENQIKQKFLEGLKEVVEPYHKIIDQSISSLTVDHERIKKERDVLMLSEGVVYCDKVINGLESGEVTLPEEDIPFLLLYLPSKGVTDRYSILKSLRYRKKFLKNDIKELYEKEKKDTTILLEKKIDEYTKSEEQRIRDLKEALQMKKIKIDNLETELFEYYSPITDIISSCPQGIYKDAFLKNFLIFEAGHYTPIGIIDFETFSNLPYQMDLATLFAGNTFDSLIEEKADVEHFLELYINEFNQQIEKHGLKKDKIIDFNKFKKEYHACAVQRNLSLFGSFVKVGEKQEYLLDCLSNSIINIKKLLPYLDKENDKVKLEGLMTLLISAQEPLANMVHDFDTYFNQN